MPYRNGKFVHPNQLPSLERFDYYERHPHPSSWGYVQQQRREEWRKECEWMSDPEELRKHNERVYAERKALQEELDRQTEETGTCEPWPHVQALTKIRKREEAKRQREAEEGTTNEQEGNNDC